MLLVFNHAIGDAIQKACENDFDSEALHLARAATIVRRDMFKMQQTFKGTFEADCQKKAIPQSLLALIDMILQGPSIKKGSPDDKPVKTAALTISQLLAFTSCKSGTEGKTTTTTHHSRDREYPLHVYTELKIHGETRKKSLVDAFYNLGLCISYDRVLSISTDTANCVTTRFEQEGVVCPPKLRGNIFTTAAVDNIDHNPSSTTAHDSFHGTAISLVQHPTTKNRGVERDIPVLDGTVQAQKNVAQLPPTFCNVPPAVLHVKDPLVPTVPDEVNLADTAATVSRMEEEYKWLDNVKELVSKDTLENDEFISWAAFHASNQPETAYEPTVVSLLPMFQENAHSVAMILHAMNIIKSAVHHVNPEQVPVVTLDQPLFAIAKQIQWNWPDTHGEDKFVIVLGGLHIEMAAFKVLGDWLDGSGWTSAIVAAEVASGGVAESFIKASHLTRTRRAHQVTAACLYILQNKAYCKYLETVDGNAEQLQFEDWTDAMSEDHPQFLYWCRVLSLELCVLHFVRSVREGNFNLYRDSLSKLAPWMFSMNHINYARWLSIHIRDMCALPAKHPEVYQHFLKGSFVVHKSQRVFSSIALDQAHEQANALVKGDGGAVGLTENPGALRRWMVAGPELARMIQEFEESTPRPVKEDRRHHDQVSSIQVSFQKDVLSLVSTFEEMGNPFEEDSKDLLVLDTKDIMGWSCPNSTERSNHWPEAVRYFCEGEIRGQNQACH